MHCPYDGAQLVRVDEHVGDLMEDRCTTCGSRWQWFADDDGMVHMEQLVEDSDSDTAGNDWDEEEDTSLDAVPAERVVCSLETKEHRGISNG